MPLILPPDPPEKERACLTLQLWNLQTSLVDLKIELKLWCASVVLSGKLSAVADCSFVELGSYFDPTVASRTPQPRLTLTQWAKYGTTTQMAHFASV